MDNTGTTFGFAFARQILAEAGNTHICNPAAAMMLQKLSDVFGVPFAEENLNLEDSELCESSPAAEEKCARSVEESHVTAQAAENLAAAALDESTRRSLLFAISYYASCVMVKDDSFSSKELEAVLMRYNSYFRHIHGCEELDQHIFEACVRDVFGYTLERSRFPLAFTRAQRVASFAAYAVLRGCSCWQDNTDSLPGVVCIHMQQRAFQSLKKIVPSLVATEVTNKLLSELLAETDPAITESDRYNEILLHILESFAELSPENLACICKVLFEYGITTDDIDRISHILSGPNSSAFREHIMSSFHQSCADGEAKYFFCAAAIVNHDRGDSATGSIENPFTRMIDSEGTDMYLLNAACVSLLLWYPKHFGLELSERRMNVKTRLEDEQIRESLLKHLRKPNGVFYPIISSVVSDLVQSELLDANTLDEDVYHTAMILLGDETLRKYAEWILTLIPVGKFNYAADHSDDRSLQSHIMKLYDRALQDDRKSGYPEHHFATLCHLGEWLDSNQRMAQLDRILAFYDKYYGGGWSDSKWRVKHLLKQSMSGPLLWKLHNTDADPVMLNAHLSPEREQALLALANTLCENSGEPETISTTEKALDIICFFRHYQGMDAPVPPVAKSLLENTRLDVNDAGSFIVLSWFQLLCAYDCGEAALDLYQRYEQILSMPWLGCPSMYEFWTGESAEAYCRYRKLMSRLQRIVADNLQKGHCAVLHAIMESKYRSTLDNQKNAYFLNHNITNIASAKVIEAAFHGLYNTTANVVRLSQKAEYSKKPDKRVCDILAPLADVEFRIMEKIDILGSQNSTKELSEADIDALVEAKAKAEQLFSHDTLATCLNSSLVDSGLHFNHAVFYDDLTVMKFIIHNHPEQCGEILRLGYGNYKPLVLLAVTANPDSFINVSLQLRKDPEICAAAHRDPEEDPFEWVRQRLSLTAERTASVLREATNRVLEETENFNT